MWGCFRYAYSKQDSKCLPSGDNTQWIRTGSNDKLKGIIQSRCSNDIRASNSECDLDQDFDINKLDEDDYEYFINQFPEYCVPICQEFVAVGEDPEFASSAVRKPSLSTNIYILKFFFAK